MLIISVATALQWLLWPIVEPAPFILFYLAVILASLYGDGVSAIILAALAAQFFFVPPMYSLEIAWPSGVVRQTLFLVSVFMIRSIARALSTASVLAQNEQKNAEEEKRKAQDEARRAKDAESWLATTLTSIGDAVIATDEKGRIAFMNPLAESLTEWTLQEAKGKPLGQVFNIINQRTRLALANPVEMVFAKGGTVALADLTLIVGRNGKETVIEDSAAPIRTSEGGPIQGVVLVFRDITEKSSQEEKLAQTFTQLQQSEARLRNILDNALDAVVGMDDQGRITHWNPQAEKIFGYTRDEAIGQKMSETIIPLRYRETHERGMRHYLASGEGPVLNQRFEITALRRDGNVFPIELSITPIKTSAQTAFAAFIRDITEQKRAVEALKDQHDLTQTITDNAASGLFMMDKKGHPTFMNPAAARITGYNSLEEIKDRPLHYAVHWKKPDGTPYPMEECPIDHAQAELKPLQNQEEIFCTKEGTLFPVSYSVAPLEKDGEVIGSVLEFKDITEQRRAEQALRSSEEKARIALAAGKMGEWDLDLVTGQAHRSLRHDQCFGYQELLPKWSFEDFLLHVHPEDREEIDRKFKTAVSNGKDWEFECRVIWPDGSVHWIAASGRATLDEGHRPLRMAGLVHDITDRKIAEQEREKILEQELKARTEAQESLKKLDALVHSLTEGLVFADPDGTLLFMNPEALRIHQFASMDAMIGRLKDYPELFVIHSVEGTELQLQDWPLSRVLRGEKFSEYQVEVYRGDTGVRWIGSFGGTPVYDEKGNLMLAVLTIRDVTEKRRTEHALREAIRARDEFLSIASHELKTPLTSLKLQAQIRKKNLARGDTAAFLPARLNTMVEGDLRQIERLSRLVEDMLDISRISTGKLSIQKESFDLCSLIQEVLHSYLPSFEAVGCKVSIICCDPVHGEWDRYRIEQVTANLLMNALKYGSNHPVQVSVSREGKWARLSVKDEGIGIAKEAQERIFQRFERAISANEISGLGLGLYISRQIVEMHGGRISVESEPGSGSTFIVDLPLEVEK